MSSILDALKKLESDKAEAPVQDDLVLDGASAERELIGDGLLRTGATVRLSPGTLIGLVFAGILLIAGVAGGAVYWATRGGSDGAVKTVVASAPMSQPIVPAAQPVPSVPAPAAPAPVVPAPAPVAPVQQPPVPVQVAVQQPAAPVAAPVPATPLPAPTPVVQPAQSVAPQPVPAVETPAQASSAVSVPPAAPQPVPPAVPAPANQAPTVVAQAQPATAAPVEPTASQVDASAKPKEKRLAKAATTKGDIVAVASSKSPVVTEASVDGDGSPDSYGAKMSAGAAPAKASVASAPKGAGDDVDVSSLPTLKESDKARLGMSDLHINMLRPASKSTPYASAVINFRQVFVGDEIPKTRAKLVGIDSGGKGVAIEISGTGERFYVRF